jgi:hypothetical protein
MSHQERGPATGFGSLARGRVDELGYLHTGPARPPHAETVTVTCVRSERS